MAIISSFLGGIKNRFMTYQEDRGIEERIKLAAKVPGLAGLEICYPADFRNFEVLKKLLQDSGLGISSINFRSRRTGAWLRGSFSSTKEQERNEVVSDLYRAMDYARDLDCDIVSTCPLNEGTDYLFESDYGSLYLYLIESLRTAAEHDPQVKLALEYKLGDPRTRCLLGTAGEALSVCNKIGLPNVGVTLDFGHSIYAGERPAQALALTALENRLFYVHMNDNDRRWDWDMMPGAFNFWDAVEFMFYLKKYSYSGWIAFDVFAKEFDVVETFSETVRLTELLAKIADTVDQKQVADIFTRRSPVESLRFMYSLIGK
jgi:xylose isomerase